MSLALYERRMVKGMAPQTIVDLRFSIVDSIENPKSDAATAKNLLEEAASKIKNPKWRTCRAEARRYVSRRISARDRAPTGFGPGDARSARGDELAGLKPAATSAEEFPPGIEPQQDLDQAMRDQLVER